MFAVGALMILAGAAGVVLLRNPVHCALALVTTLFGIALLFIDQGADFLAAVQIIVYAGAVVILFLFVIMLLGVDRKEARDPREAEGPDPGRHRGRGGGPGRAPGPGRGSTTGPPAPRPGPGASTARAKTFKSSARAFTRPTSSLSK